MASVFLSYDRDDAAAAGFIARTLEKAGHSVWWDRQIAGGSEYSREIEQALAEAEAVVVLWSAQSVQSPWVRDEAASGRDRGRLVPVRLDTTNPPLGFRQYQTLDLRRGRIGKAQRQALLHAVATASGSPVDDRSKRQSTSSSVSFRRSWIIAGALLALICIAGAMLQWRPWADHGGTILAIGPASSDGRSQSLARELASKLASLQSDTSAPLLVEASEQSRKPDLLFEVGAASSTPNSASLLLKSGKDRSILWSREFEQPSDQRADLLQQVAVTAARVAACATEGDSSDIRLKPATLKTYLNACAQLAEMATVDPKPPIQSLIEVIEESPRFLPAWSRLLLAEAEVTSRIFNGDDSDPRDIAILRRHIAAARAVDPHLPEADIAEALLLPPRDFIGRGRKIESAALRSRDNAPVLAYLAGHWGATGRSRDAIEAMARAVQKDPFSPSLQSSFIATLAYGGRLDAAERELLRAERIWPGTASLWDAQYRFHLRYGDPKIARQVYEEHANSGGEAMPLYLAARIDPRPENIERLMSYVQERLANMENPRSGLGFAILAYGHFRKTEEVLDTLLKWPDESDVSILSEVLFRPEFETTRRNPRFLLVARRAGLLDYWKNSGKWPDFCFEPGFPYDCKAEAAKIN